MSRKELLHYTDLIPKLEEMGINFQIINTKHATQILKENNYFFKLGAFRKNFEKNENGKYEIDFAYLSDLASLDMQLRYICLHMCLDLEHTIKCIILDHVTEKKDEDGYSIMKYYFSEKPEQKEYIFSNVMDHDGNVSPGFKKYFDSPPIWVCLELMDFGCLNRFVRFYLRTLSTDELKKLPFSIELINASLMSVKNIRNKCAHSRPLIFNIKYTQKFKVPKSLLNVGLQKYFLTTSQMKNIATSDLLGVFHLHDCFCSSAIKKNRKDSLIEWNTRAKRNEKYYKNSPDIRKFFNTLNKLISKHNC